MNDAKISKRSLRYLAYCSVHGYENDPDGMLAEDLERWPGGRMAGFQLWIQMCWREFLLRNPDVCSDAKTDEDHRRFDQWLEGKAYGEKRGA